MSGSCVCGQAQHYDHNTGKLNNIDTDYLIMASEKYRVTNEHFVLKFKCLKQEKNGQV